MIKKVNFEIWEENDGSLGLLIEQWHESIIVNWDNISDLLKNLDEALQLSNKNNNELNLIKALLFNYKHAN